MSAPLRLVLFDVDGTLVDSQGSIVHSMTTSFQAASVPVPSRDAILSIVGLSLPHAIARLAPDQPSLVQSDLVEGYKEAYHTHIGLIWGRPVHRFIPAHVRRLKRYTQCPKCFWE